MAFPAQVKAEDSWGQGRGIPCPSPGWKGRGTLSWSWQGGAEQGVPCLGPGWGVGQGVPCPGPVRGVGREGIPCPGSGGGKGVDSWSWLGYTLPVDGQTK